MSPLAAKFAIGAGRVGDFSEAIALSESAREIEGITQSSLTFGKLIMKGIYLLL